MHGRILLKLAQPWHKRRAPFPVGQGGYLPYGRIRRLKNYPMAPIGTLSIKDILVRERRADTSRAAASAVF